MEQLKNFKILVTKENSAEIKRIADENGMTVNEFNGQETVFTVHHCYYVWIGDRNVWKIDTHCLSDAPEITLDQLKAMYNKKRKPRAVKTESEEQREFVLTMLGYRDYLGCQINSHYPYISLEKEACFSKIVGNSHEIITFDQWLKETGYEFKPKSEQMETEYKGQLKGFPKEVVEKMLERQVEQGNPRSVEVFERICASDTSGFVWGKSPEGIMFWGSVIFDKNFDLFFKKYPKQKQATEHGAELEITGYELTEKCIEIISKRGRATIHDKFIPIADIEDLKLFNELPELFKPIYKVEAPEPQDLRFNKVIELIEKEIETTSAGIVHHQSSGNSMLFAYHTTHKEVMVQLLKEIKSIQ